MPTHPYLHFQGTCAEAMSFYAQALGGTDLSLMRYAESPGAPEAWTSSGNVMHAQVKVGAGVLMASDFPPGLEGDPQKGFSVMQTFATAEATRAAFDRLGEGGAVIRGFGPNFFSSGFGMVRDRFGTHWILSTDPEPGAPRPDASDQEPEAHPT